MTQKVFIDMNVFVSQQFKESVSEASGNSKIYMIYGKNEAWANDAAPDTPQSCLCTLRDAWQTMVGGKIVTGNDLEHVIARYDWMSGVEYPGFYDRGGDLRETNSQFYILTSNYGVYKCLSNNYGEVSTIEPTSTNPNTVTQTADGYIWKYMYSLNSEDKYRFLTDDWMPVRTLTEDNGSDQWNVQQAAKDGAIYSILIEDGGNYVNVNNIVITISGTGQSANAYANVVNNSIDKVIIDDFGAGYEAPVTITVTGGGGTGGANLRAILPPPGGHGSDPLYELGGRNIMLNMRVSGSEDGKLPLVNEVRQLTFIQDPLRFTDGTIMANASFKQTTDITLTGVGSSYVEDEYVYQGVNFSGATFVGRIVEWDSANSKVKLNRVSGTPSADVLIGQNTGTTGFIVSTSDPELEKYSGRMLYIENFEPISRDENQTENFQIVLQF